MPSGLQSSPVVIVVRPDLPLELSHVQDAVIALQGPAHDAGQDGRTSRLVVVDVATDIAEEFVAGLRVDLDADLVRHRAGRHVQGSFFAEQRRDALLQPIHRRVFAEDIVADLGRSDGRPHTGGGPGDGIASEVDNGVGHGEEVDSSR